MSPAYADMTDEQKVSKNASDRRWREANRDRRRAVDRAYREANREHLREKNRIWYEANREQELARYRAWSVANRPRRRAMELEAKYGLTPTAYGHLLIGQSGRCAICAEPMWRPREPVVDHDHDTGQVRGLLCNPCNRGLGNLGDNLDGLQRAVDYLLAAKAKENTTT